MGNLVQQHRLEVKIGKLGILHAGVPVVAKINDDEDFLGVTKGLDAGRQPGEGRSVLKSRGSGEVGTRGRKRSAAIVLRRVD